jgi:hypothetical protein
LTVSSAGASSAPEEEDDEEEAEAEQCEAGAGMGRRADSTCRSTRSTRSFNAAFSLFTVHPSPTFSYR